VRRVLTLGVSGLVIGITLPLIATIAFAPSASTPEASAKAASDIPTPMLEVYQQAAETCPGLDWSVLAAVGKIETDHARSTATSSAGAEGPMQFMPGTWNRFRLDGDNDGRSDVQNPRDAIFSAANYLCANGAGNPSNLDAAVYRYNHSESYVRAVRNLAAEYSEAAPLSQDVPDILNNSRIVLTSRAESDVRRGLVDPRVLVVLDRASTQHTLAVSVFKSGHSRCVGGGDYVGCHTSNHFYGRGADIYSVDGTPVNSRNIGARALTVWLYSLPREIRPSEIGSPFVDLTAGPLFTDEDHRDHIHIGFDR
jgi:hypothetical protein